MLLPGMSDWRQGFTNKVFAFINLWQLQIYQYNMQYLLKLKISEITYFDCSGFHFYYKNY